MEEQVDVRRERTGPSLSQFLEVTCKSSGKVRRFACGTESGFALYLINRKLEGRLPLALHIEAVKEGEEPVSFGLNSVLVNYGKDWKLQTVAAEGLEHTNQVQRISKPPSSSATDTTDPEHLSTDSEPQTTFHSSPISGQALPTTLSTINKSRSSNFNVDEDKLLVSAWLNVSSDVAQSYDTKRSHYWLHVWEYYHKHKTFVTDRSRNSLIHRWSTLQIATNKFCGCYAQIDARQESGVDEHEKIVQAKVMYKSIYSVAFLYEHFWRELRDQPKWIEEYQKKPAKKKARTTPFSGMVDGPSVDKEA